MKHGRNLTLKQKEILQTVGLNPSNWLLVKNPPDKLVLVHREKGTLTEIPLFEGKPLSAY
ncbi:MAG: hypothetical protein GX625_14405 [Clostridiaceae bacterium]|nr:hypothetical protein [Clostridiaceae bacterium]